MPPDAATRDTSALNLDEEKYTAALCTLRTVIGDPRSREVPVIGVIYIILGCRGFWKIIAFVRYRGDRVHLKHRSFGCCALYGADFSGVGRGAHLFSTFYIIEECMKFYLTLTIARSVPQSYYLNRQSN